MRGSDQEVWVEVDKARGELADLLESLTPDQWDRQSLCAAWRVRDVAGHVAIRTTSIGSLAGVAANGFNVNRWLAKAAIDNGQRSQPELVAALRNRIGERTTPPFTKPMDVLTDVVVHTQDIRRPLHLPGASPLHRWEMIADFVKDHRFYGTAKRREGLCLRATDSQWCAGEGSLVQGPLEAIVLALLGRKQVFDDLAGDGARTLKSRL